MTPYSAAEERLTGKRSLRLLLSALAVTLGVAFFGELAIMFALPHLLPADASELTRTLFDAGLLALLLAVVILPLLLHLRRRNLRVLRRALRLQYTLDQHAIVSMTDVTGRIAGGESRRGDQPPGIAGLGHFVPVPQQFQCRFGMRQRLRCPLRGERRMCLQQTEARELRTGCGAFRVRFRKAMLRSIEAIQRELRLGLQQAGFH